MSGLWRLAVFPVLAHEAWQSARQAFLRTEKTRLFLRGSLGILVLRAASVGLRIAVGVLLARLLSASGYGTYAFALAWMTFLVIPATMGLEHVVLRYVSVYREMNSWPALRGVLQWAVASAAGAGTLVGFFAIAAVALAGELDAQLRITMWVMFAALPVAVLAQVRQSWLRGLDQPVLAQIPETIVYPGLTALSLVAAHFLAGVSIAPEGAAVANAGALLASLAVGTFFALRALPEAVRSAAPSYHARQWMAMVPPLIFIGGAYHLASRGDVLVLGMVAAPRDVGVYVAAARGAELMLFAYDAATVAGASLFAGIYASGDSRELQRFTTLAARTILWASLPVCLVLAALAPVVLGIFGEEFVEGAGVMRLLLTTYFLSSLGGFIIPMLYMTGHQNDVAVAMGGAALLNVGLSYVLIPGFGIMGAGIASGTTLILLKGALVVVLARREGIMSLPVKMGAPILRRP